MLTDYHHPEGELGRGTTAQGRGGVKSVKGSPSCTQTHPLPAPPNALKSQPGFVVSPPRGRNAHSPQYKGSRGGGGGAEPRSQDSGTGGGSRNPGSAAAPAQLRGIQACKATFLLSLCLP